MVVLAECGPWRERQELLTSDSVVWIPPTCCLSSSQLQNDKGFLFFGMGNPGSPLFQPTACLFPTLPKRSKLSIFFFYLWSFKHLLRLLLPPGATAAFLERDLPR